MFVPRINAKKCVICDSPLSVHQRAAGVVCGNPRCKHEQVKKRLQVENRRLVELTNKALAYRAQAAPKLGVEDAESFELAILPSNDQRLVTLPEKRKRRFRDHLLQVIATAAAQHYGDRKKESESIASEGLDAETPRNGNAALMGNACATCRGFCCQTGGNHAYIQVGTIARYMQDHPDHRPRDVLDAYLSRVGNESYEQSCIFHDRHGCRLPRDMRSKVCNQYCCKGLTELLGRLNHTGESRGFAVATSNQQIVRAALIDESTRIDCDPTPEDSRTAVRPSTHCDAT